MRYILIIILAFVAFTTNCNAQWVVDTLTTASKVSEQEVNFLSEAPVIDGTLDKQLETLPVRNFSFLMREEENKTVPVPVTYRIAYGTEFLYVYIEADAEHLTFRDRAYQNGDGFLVLIARPKPNNEATDEFYELACSAVNTPECEWSRHLFWNYNVDKLFVPTGLDTKLEFHEGNGKISFELFLPWVDVRPNHPWLSDGIGFNLTFCKAVEPEGVLWYQTVSDKNTGEEFKKRRYEPLRFQKPVVNGNPQTFLSVKEGHVTEGQPINAMAVTVSDKVCTENLEILYSTGESFVYSDYENYECEPGITKHEFPLSLNGVLEGGYSIRWNSNRKISQGLVGLTVLPKFEDQELNQRLGKNKKYLSESSYNTVQFMVKEMKSKLESLKTYETSRRERNGIIRLMRMIDLTDRGIDPFKEKSGFTRKAYQSKIDNSLQPYTVYVPENYDKNKKYPLMVFLHGSASDETNLYGFDSLIPKDFIAIGPLGRGESNGFCRDNAQNDIAEVIASVSNDYSVDTTRILLTGFSMGGYGVYRSYYETPKKYKAIAIFSGGPDIGKDYAPIELAPNFSNEKNLTSFRNLPVFIFHGEKDLNVSLPITLELADKLKKIGAQVELQIEPDNGHGIPGKEIVDNYMKWVNQVMK